MNNSQHIIELLIALMLHKEVAIINKEFIHNWIQWRLKEMAWLIIILDSSFTKLLTLMVHQESKSLESFKGSLTKCQLLAPELENKYWEKSG